ncbi:MAG: PIN domain protein, partial [Sedimentisphaerales bacterium]
MKQLRVYADTSVFGGCFDVEFAEESKSFFEDIKAGKFIVVVSSTTLGELDRALQQVQKVLAGLPTGNMEIIEFSDEVARLRDAYLDAGIVGPEGRAD